MATATPIAFALTAKDLTAGAFSSMQSRAQAASASFRRAAAGIIATAATYVSARAVVSGINQLGHLSDVAMKASMSVHDLTRMSEALGILGIQGNAVDTLAQAMSYMAKTTGETGMAGFRRVITAIAQIPDEAKRGEAAMAVFGRSGLNFMPLIRAAEQGTGALDKVIAGMSGVSDAAASAGDEAADAMNICIAGIKNVWLEALGALSAWTHKAFGMDLHQAAMVGVANISYFAKAGWSYFSDFASNIGIALSHIVLHFPEFVTSILTDIGGLFVLTGELVWNLLKSLGTLAKNFGVQLWEMIKGNGFDFDQLFNGTEFRASLEKFTTEMKQTLVDNDPLKGVQLVNSEADRQRWAKDRDAVVARAKDAAAAMNEAAKGAEGADSVSVAGSPAAAGAKSSAQNELVLAGSYKALALGAGGDSSAKVQKQTQEIIKGQLLPLIQKMATATTAVADATEAEGAI